MRIALYIRSTRGLSALKSALEVDAIDIRFVVYDGDISIQDNEQDEIISTCSEYEVACFSKSGLPSKLEPVDFSFFIAWRFVEKLNSGQSIAFHDSDLPRYRGYSPTVSMLINGESYLASTAFFMSEGYDDGPIILQRKIDIKYPITLKQAFFYLSQMYAEMMTTLLNWIVEGKSLPATKQNDDEATYSIWRDEKDLFIDWSCSADMLKRKIDALGYPYNGARTFLGNTELLIHNAVEMPDKVFENRDYGKIFSIDNGMPCVICGKGVLCLTELSFLNSGVSALPLKKIKQRFFNAN